MKRQLTGFDENDAPADLVAVTPAASAFCAVMTLTAPDEQRRDFIRRRGLRKVPLEDVTAEHWLTSAGLNHLSRAR